MLSDSTFLDVLTTMLTFAKMCELGYCCLSIPAKTEDIEADLRVANFLAKHSLASYKRNIWVAKTTLQCSETLKIVKNEEPDVSGAPHPDGKTLATSMNADTVFLLRTT